MSKNILVTGGCGFIGSHVVDALIKKKYKVTIFDLVSPGRKDVKFIKFGEEALEFSKNFHWNKIVKNYLKLIN